MIEVPLDPRVTPELFLEWRTPRFGRSNPEPMNNPVWEWLVRSEINAYQATERMNGPSPFDAGPTWCFDRFGQSSTPLPDGRIVFIAGEHEDHYDPDFHIYNDVTVRHPDGRIDFYCYPREDFPPTDFHSATLVGNRIILIGNLGYPQDRNPNATQVLVLDIETFAITRVTTTGTPPGWISSHLAVLSEDRASILLQRGKLNAGDNRSLVENFDDWQLHLTDWQWQKVTDRCWSCWEVRRKDGRQNHLMHYQIALFHKDLGSEGDLQKRLGELSQELGRQPDFDLIKRLYRPGIAHEELPEIEDECGVHRRKIDGVVVRYVESFHAIQFTIEGDLPQGIGEALAVELRDKMTALENTECELVRL